MHNAKYLLIVMYAILVMAWSNLGTAMQWKPHTVRQLNGSESEIRIPAQLQIATESWNRVVAIPYIVYMPEKDRLLMSVLCDLPHHPMVLHSDDKGASWSEPTAGGGLGLTYLGNGKALAFPENLTHLSISNDYGETWNNIPQETSSKDLYAWDPLLSVPNPNGGAARLAQGCWRPTGIPWGSADAPYSQGYFRFSPDEGKTWSNPWKVPQWLGINEISMIIAKNNNWVAACRTDCPKRFAHLAFDHFGGLGISISKDQGKTWSDVNILYEWGRHHPSMLLLPNGDVLMSYVVRLGYVRTSDGFPQFGVEAVVSHDNGQTWDLDHRYLLHTWVGNRKSPDHDGPGPRAWWASSQSTSSVLLPDGSVLTAFGSGYRSQPFENSFSPRDVGLVLWKLGTERLNDERTIRNAPFNSEMRNMFDPAAGKPALSKIH